MMGKIRNNARGEEKLTGIRKVFTRKAVDKAAIAGAEAGCGKGLLERGVNIRRDGTEPDVWRPTGMPARLRGGNARPVARVQLRGSDVGGKECVLVLWSDGKTLEGATGNGDDGMATLLRLPSKALGEVKGMPLMADVVDEGVIRVMLRHERAVYLTYDRKGEVTFHGEMPLPQGAGFVVTDEVTMSEPVANVKLTGLSRVPSGPLNAEDCRRVTAAVTEAYDRLVSKAMKAGYLIQPALARWRLTDGAGDTIALGGPVMVCASTGFQCSGGIEMTSSDSLGSLSGGAVTARAYRIRLVAPPKCGAPWNRIIRSLRVEMTPQADVADRGGRSVCNVSGNGREITVTAYLPGCGGSAQLLNSFRRKLITDSLREADTRMRVQEEYSYPYSEGFADRTVPIHTGGRPVTERGSDTERDALSFSTACRCGDLTILGNSRREKFRGHSVRELAISGNGPAGYWQGIASVTIAMPDGDEERAVAVCNGNGGCPVAMSPLLVYPDARAREMKLTLRASTGIVTGTFELTSMPEAGLAYYLREDLLPAPLPESTDIVETALP
ncbi:MAG: hypothetical protein K2H14_09125, partial [Muribaculaceae bacterium]|nr:hypothetical protein [Muribaculaceae bacterium]